LTKVFYLHVINDLTAWSASLLKTITLIQNMLWCRYCKGKRKSIPMTSLFNVQKTWTLFGKKLSYVSDLHSHSSGWNVSTTTSEVEATENEGNLLVQCALTFQNSQQNE
jgi:hypothetical protein